VDGLVLHRDRVKRRAGVTNHSIGFKAECKALAFEGGAGGSTLSA
jgi:hypothetical protein